MSPRRGPTADTGWRKASVVLVGMVCLTVLRATSAIDDGVFLPTFLGLAGAYLGINLLGYRPGKGG